MRAEKPQIASGFEPPRRERPGSQGWRKTAVDLKGHGFQPCRKTAKQIRLEPLRDGFFPPRAVFFRKLFTRAGPKKLRLQPPPRSGCRVSGTTAEATGFTPWN
jgi:hypothetical protein